MAGLTVVDAARRLGIDASRVRQMLRLGELAGQRHGRVWIVDEAAVAKRAHRPVPGGRPLAPARAWALLDLIDGGSAPWLTTQSRSQVRARARGLQGAPPERLRAVLRSRSSRRWFSAHPAALSRLTDDRRVIVAGAVEATRAGLDLVSVHSVPELYVRETDLPELIRTLSLRPAATRSDVLIRVPREVWPFAGRSAGPAVLAADLLESDEPRAVTAAGDWIGAHLSRAGSRAAG